MAQTVQPRLIEKRVQKKLWLLKETRVNALPLNTSVFVKANKIGCAELPIEFCGESHLKGVKFEIFNEYRRFQK